MESVEEGTTDPNMECGGWDLHLMKTVNTT